MHLDSICWLVCVFGLRFPPELYSFVIGHSTHRHRVSVVVSTVCVLLKSD